MERREFLLAAHLEAGTLEGWIEAGWLLPRDRGEGGTFSEIDLARAQLIRDLGELGVNEEGIPVILDLVDQLHGVRGVLRELLSAISTQPEGQRHQILSGVRTRGSERRRRT
jgi:chaperone modulatory protein CbpM